MNLKIETAIFQKTFKEVLIKSLEILRDFKGAKPNSRPLRYPFLPYRHTPAKRCLDVGNLACPESKRCNQNFLNWRRLLLQAWVLGLPFTLAACGGSTVVKPGQGAEEVGVPAGEKSQEKTVWRYGLPPDRENGEVKVLGAQTPEQMPEGSELQAEDLGPEEESEQQASQETTIDYQPVVYFNYDQEMLTDEAVQTVRFYAKILLDDPMKRVKLLGHTDERGSPEYNLALGERRAKAVYEVMVVFGVNPEQIEVISYGEEKPAVDDHNETAWAKNRRVEIVIY